MQDSILRFFPLVRETMNPARVPWTSAFFAFASTPTNGSWVCVCSCSYDFDFASATRFRGFSRLALTTGPNLPFFETQQAKVGSASQSLEVFLIPLSLSAWEGSFSEARWEALREGSCLLFRAAATMRTRLSSAEQCLMVRRASTHFPQRLQAVSRMLSSLMTHGS